MMSTYSDFLSKAQFPRTLPTLLLAVMPLVFVLIWATGFIVAKYGMPYAPPMKFLALRFALSVVCFAVWVYAARAAWPKERMQWFHLAVTGILMHGIYLGGVWAAIKLGMGAGVTSLLVALQPILTAIWLSSRGSRVAPAQWAGLALGLIGLLLVVWEKLGLGEVHPVNLVCAIIALLGITTGTLYQKRFVQACDVRTASFIQLVAACLFTLPFVLFEHESIQWLDHGGHINIELVGAMFWSVFGMTLGGSSLLYLLIQRGAATSVTSLFYLVPPTTALIAWILFGDALTILTIVGTALTAAGIIIVTRYKG